MQETGLRVCLRAGAWLLRDWAALVSQGSQESQEQVLGVCVAT